MRIGAIFARGSCRTLKWMALFGVVFALGAGSAAAQITPDPMYDTDGFKVEGLGKTIGEGEGATITVSMRATIPAGTANPTTVNVAVTVVAPAAETPDDDTDNYEPADIVLNNAAVSLVFSSNPETDADPKKETKSATVFLQTTNDVDAEREDFALDIDVTGGATSITQENIESTIVDDEEQTYVLKITTEEPSEGTATIDGTVTAEPAHVNMAASLRLHLDDPDYSLDNATSTGFAIGAGAVASHPFMITPPENDKNRVEDTVTVSLFSGTAGNSVLEDSEAVEVADLNALPAVTATVILLDEDGDPVDPQPEDGVESIAEGQTVDLKINVVDKDNKALDAAEELMVMLTPTGDAGAQDYRLSMHPVVVALGDDSATIELTASEDQDVGMEMLMFDATVSGDADIGPETRDSAGIVSLAIMDTTMKLVEAKSDEEIQAVVYAAKDAGEGADEMFNPGETIMVDASMLFTAAEGVSVVYTASSDMMDVAGVSSSGSMVTVTAGMPGGPAHVTITATAQSPSGAMALTQTSPNVAQVRFPVEVELTDLAVMVTADPMEIMEGESSTITATANRAVTEDTTIMLEVISSDGSDDHTLEIMIANGMTSGSTMLGAAQDDDYDDMSYTVVATGPGIDGSQNLVIRVTDDDEMPEPPEPTNVITAKSSDDIYPMLMAAGLAGDDAMFNPGMMAELDASMMFDVMEGYSASYAAESDAMNVASASVSGNMVTVMAGEAGMAHVVITGTAAMASGVMTGQPATNVATVMFPVNVMNMPLEVTVSTDPMDMVEEGGTITVTAMANRDVVADDGDVEVMLTITGAVEMNEMMISIAAGMMSGTAMVQVLDDMEVAPMADITIVATGSGIATAQTFTIAVTENDSPRTFTLMAPEDMMNLVEGGDGVELTVTADPAVSVDTEVMIMLDRAASTADADDFTAEPIMIMAGETSGTTMLMAVEDGMDDSGHASPEMLVVFAMADNTQSNSVSFYIWDMAVPALPIIAQLLLAAFLAIGGYRRYLRR